MASTAEPEAIPMHQPIVVCPTCRVHTAHVMLRPGEYRCRACDTTHGLAPMRKAAHEQEPMWCPTCRSVEKLSPFWAPVGGRRQCRVCLGWVVVPTREGRI